MNTKYLILNYIHILYNNYVYIFFPPIAIPKGADIELIRIGNGSV